jgi:hypothetical protein
MAASHLDSSLDTSIAASHLDSSLNSSTAALTPRLKGDRGQKTVQIHLGASSAAYTAIRTKLTIFNTADKTSSSFTGKGTMDIDGRAGATGVAVAGGTLAK